MKGHNCALLGKIKRLFGLGDIKKGMPFFTNSIPVFYGKASF